MLFWGEIGLNLAGWAVICWYINNMITGLKTFWYFYFAR